MLLEKLIIDNDDINQFDLLLSSLSRSTGFNNDNDILLYNLQNHMLNNVGGNGDGTDYHILNDILLQVLNDLIRTRTKSSHIKRTTTTIRIYFYGTTAK